MTVGNEKRMKRFTAELQRVLYLLQITNHSIEALKDSSLCRTQLKVALNNIVNSNKRLVQVTTINRNGDSCADVLQDISSDRLHDISLHIDEIMNAQNISEITEILKQCKQPIALPDQK